MSCKNGNTYVGLTDDPDRRKKEHGSPSDWRVVRHFTRESDAREWEATELKAAGTCGDTGGAGWRKGYKYTVSSATRE